MLRWQRPPFTSGSIFLIGNLARMFQICRNTYFDFPAHFNAPNLFFSHPGYFGKVGMRHIHLKKNKFYCPVINVDQLWALVGESVRQNYEKTPHLAPVVNCVQKVSSSHCFSLKCRLICSLVSKAFATETVGLRLIRGRIKPKITKSGIHSFPA